VTSTVHFTKVRQALVDFQLIPTPSLGFQVALNLGETAPLIMAKLKELGIFSLEYICTQTHGTLRKQCDHVYLTTR